MSLLYSFLGAFILLAVIIAIVAAYASLTDRWSAQTSLDTGEIPATRAEPILLLGGALLIPGNPDDFPEIRAIEKALTRVVKLLANDKAKKQRLQETLADLTSRRPSPEDFWHEQLISVADRNSWPHWAVLALPSLYLRSQSPDQPEGEPGGEFTYVWSEVLNCFPNDHAAAVEPVLWSELSRLCAGEVVRLKVSSTGAKLINVAARQLELIRLEYPFDDPHLLHHAVRAEVEVLGPLTGDDQIIDTLKAHYERMLKKHMKQLDVDNETIEQVARTYPKMLEDDLRRLVPAGNTVATVSRMYDAILQLHLAVQRASQAFKSPQQMPT